MSDIFSNVTPLAIVLVLIVLTDRWVVRFYRVLTEHLQRVELKHNQMILLLEKCLADSSAIQDSFLSGPERELE